MDINIAEGYFYTKEHEWAKIDGNRAKIGITDYAQQKLGDITYIELPETGKEVTQFEVLTGIESVKAATDIYAPVSGEVIAINEALEEEPEIINESPYGDGWFFKMKIHDAAEFESLLNAADYIASTEEEE